jgi:hypothetical protein
LVCGGREALSGGLPGSGLSIQRPERTSRSIVNSAPLRHAKEFFVAIPKNRGICFSPRDNSIGLKMLLDSLDGMLRSFRFTF